MKKQVYKVIALSSLLLLLVSGVSYGQEGYRVIANIPFAFIAGNNTLPAGEYTIDRPNENEPGLLLIRGVDSNLALFVNAENVETKQTPDKTELVFNEIGNKYFLSRIWVSGDDTGREIPKPRAERELEKVALTQVVTLQPTR
jgi:hypothetical protein